jgi:hypothetical protein
MRIVSGLGSSASVAAPLSGEEAGRYISIASRFLGVTEGSTLDHLQAFHDGVEHVGDCIIETVLLCRLAVDKVWLRLLDEFILLADTFEVTPYGIPVNHLS